MLIQEHFQLQISSYLLWELNELQDPTRAVFLFCEHKK